MLHMLRMFVCSIVDFIPEVSTSGTIALEDIKVGIAFSTILTAFQTRLEIAKRTVVVGSPRFFLGCWMLLAKMFRNVTPFHFYAESF